jgi:hypothetical protein
MEMYGEWIYTSMILDVGTSWRGVASFTPGHFLPGEMAPSTLSMGGWVGLRTLLDDLKKRKISLLYGPFGRAARSQSLYQL